MRRLLTYYKNLFQRSFGVMRSTWSSLNDVMGHSGKKGKIDSILDGEMEIHDDGSIAEIFNNFFPMFHLFWIKILMRTIWIP